MNTEAVEMEISSCTKAERVKQLAAPESKAFLVLTENSQGMVVFYQHAAGNIIGQDRLCSQVATLSITIDKLDPVIKQKIDA